MLVDVTADLKIEAGVRIWLFFGVDNAGRCARFFGFEGRLISLNRARSVRLYAEMARERGLNGRGTSLRIDLQKF